MGPEIYLSQDKHMSSNSFYRMMVAWP